MGRYILMAGGGILFILFEAIGLILLLSKKKKPADAAEEEAPAPTVDEALPKPHLNPPKGKKNKKGRKSKKGENPKPEGETPPEIPTDPESPVNPFVEPPAASMTAPVVEVPESPGAPTPRDPAPGTGIHCDAAPYLHELFLAFQKASSTELSGCESSDLVQEHTDIITEYNSMGIKRCMDLVSVVSQSDINIISDESGWEHVTSRVVCNVQDYLINSETRDPVSGSESKTYEVTYLIVFVRPNATESYTLDKINLIHV